jgi:hypothetical protein
VNRSNRHRVLLEGDADDPRLGVIGAKPTLMRGQAQTWTSFRWSVCIVNSDQTLDQLTNTAKRLERDREQRDRLIARATGEGASRREVASGPRLSVGAVQQILKRLGALMLLGGLALLMLTMPPAAHATPARDVRAERIVERIEAATIQGFRDDSLSIAELRAKMKRGEKLIASCGTDAHLASEELHRAGIKARVVGAVTRHPFDDWNDGHIMVEGPVWKADDVRSWRSASTEVNGNRRKDER